jgi:hypothetical protein
MTLNFQAVGRRANSLELLSHVGVDPYYLLTITLQIIWVVADCYLDPFLYQA